jgi:hypothetical protein
MSPPDTGRAPIVSPRWHIEVTFEEVRAHLGLETQREWSTRAVGRATPCLLGLFSLVVTLQTPFTRETADPARGLVPESGAHLHRCARGRTSSPVGQPESTNCPRHF